MNRYAVPRSICMITAALALAACGSDAVEGDPPIDADPPATAVDDGEIDAGVADDSELPTDEELDARDEARVAPDLAIDIEPSAFDAAPGETVTVDVTVSVLDTTFVNGPVVVLDTDSGVSVSSAEGCESIGSEVRCVIAPSMSGSVLPVVGPVLTLELGIPADARSRGDIVIPIHAESFENPVDVDADPSNNRTEIIVTVTG